MQNDYIRPYRSARIITVADYGDTGTPFPEGVTRGVKIESPAAKANLTVIMAEGQELVLEGLQSNIIHMLAIKAIKETSTTATKVTIFW
jgi:hypothetical protein